MGASKSSSEACRPFTFVTGSWRDFKHSHPTSWRFCFWLRPDITTRTSFLTVFQHISCWSWKKTGRTFEIQRTSSLCRTTKALFWKWAQALSIGWRLKSITSEDFRQLKSVGTHREKDQNHGAGLGFNVISLRSAGLLSLLSLHRLSFELSKWQGWKPAFVTKFPTFFQPPTSPPHAPQWNPLRGALRVGHHASSRSQERCHHRSAGKVRFGPRGRSGGQEVSNPRCLLMAPVQRRAMVLVHDTLPGLPSPPPCQGCRSFQPPRLPA
ncbi:uncharacterized protein LOC142364291 isoform X1 [Opisthocomus hoazin]|uniref:uncharacterized protein LOC142364291 isoform X1 n=1 Tax=Opisthocomus hoazin TaxID=30419 RepID=UPI003F52D655